MLGILGGLALEEGSHNAIGTSDSAIVPERFPPALRLTSRYSNQALHRLHSDDVRGQQVGIEVSGNHGRAAASPSVVQTPWVRVGTTSTFGAQPIRRQVVEEEASGGLSSVSGWSSGASVGRGFRARPQVGLEQGGSVAAAVSDASIGTTQSSSGLLQGSNACALLAETELVPGVDGHGTQLVRPATQSARKGEAMESRVDILLPSLAFTGKGERMAGMRQTRAATIAARLKSSLPPGEGEPSRMDMVAELIAEGYSDSRIQAFSTQQKHFTEFCESDGYDWLVAGKHAMCAWIVHMYETSIEQVARW
jgi:hypothetical protein